MLTRSHVLPAPVSDEHEFLPSIASSGGKLGIKPLDTTVAPSLAKLNANGGPSSYITIISNTQEPRDFQLLYPSCSPQN